MARTATNDTKRNEMKEVVAALFANGWTQATLAILFKVSSSAVSSWANGKSMGTNSLRSNLAATPAFSKDLVKKALERDVAEAEKDVAEREAGLGAVKAEFAAKPVRTDDWDWGRCDYYAVTTVDPVTGDCTKNVVQVFKQAFGNSKVGDIETRTETRNEYASHTYRIGEAKEELAAAKKKLATWIKKNG